MCKIYFTPVFVNVLCARLRESHLLEPGVMLDIVKESKE